MLRGCGASGAASLGPSSFAAAASAALSNAGLHRAAGYWPSCLLLSCERALASWSSPQSSAAQTSLQSSAQQAPEASTSAAPAQNDQAPRPSVQFSLRPSVLSPLFPVWDNARQSARRRDHLLALMRAHTLLSSNFRGTDEAIVSRMVRKRVESIQRTASQLRLLLDDRSQNTSLSCPTPAHAPAYCAALEASALRSDPVAREFSRVAHGEASPWEHYARHFHDPYRTAPRLQPLEVIFSKPDPAELLRQLRTPASSPSSGAAAAGTTPGKRSSIGPHIDIAGVTHAAGKRKASTATLDLVPGSGRITVNGLPLDLYFRDPTSRRYVLEPLSLAGSETAYDITAKVHGGGPTGQAQAVRTAVARALCVQRPALAGKLGELTRWDGRVVERKKPAREKARRGYTWVKR